MKHLLLLLLPLSLFAATGDITQVAVRDDGWSVDVVFEGYAPSNTYNFQHISRTNISTVGGILVTNIYSYPGPNSPRLIISSPGFDATGVSNYLTRYAWFTKQVRSNYANQAIIDERAAAGFVTNRVGLDMPVFAGDSVTATIPSNFYSNNAAMTGGAAVNNSVMTWPKPIANWTRPSWDRITSTTMRVGVVGFDGMADGSNYENLNGPNRTGQPLACVKVIAQDENSNEATNIITRMSVDTDYNKTAPFWGVYGEHRNANPAEYLADMDVSAFTAHDQIRVDFIAYPQWGTNPLSTLDNAFVLPRPASITNLYDPSDNFSGFVAVVDPVGGNDSNGRATNTTYGLVPSTLYYATLTAAWNAVTASNNIAGGTTHNNPGGGKVYIVTTNGTGNVNWTSGTLSAGATTVAKCWAETLTFPGQAQAVITNRLNDRNVGHRVKLTNIKLAVVDPAVPFNAIGAMWLDRCTLDTAGTQPFLSCTNIFLTHCSITNLAQGLKPASGSVADFTIVRGCDLNGLQNSCSFYTMIGNVRPTTNRTGFSISDHFAAGNNPAPDFGILYNNYLGGLLPNSAVSLVADRNCANGLAAVQNVMEDNNAANQAVASFGSTGNFVSTNVLIWNNTITGERVADWASNGTETTTVWRQLWSQHNNISDLSGFKKDYDQTADADRIGNWPVLFNCNGSGNQWVECRVNSAAATFPPDWAGFYSRRQFSTAETNIINWPGYIDRQSSSGDGVAKAGGGNYAVSAAAPQQGVSGRWVLPYDILGNARGSSDPAGAYSSANPRKGGGFF